MTLLLLVLGGGLAATPDGKFVLHIGTEGALRVHDARRGTLRAEIAAHMGSATLSLSLDGKRLATCGADGFVRIWDMARLKEIRTLRGEGAAALSPDGKLAALGTGKDIRLVEVETAKEVRRFASGLPKLVSLSFSPDGKILAAGGRRPRSLGPSMGLAFEGTPMKSWDTATGEARPDGPFGHHVAFSPSGLLVVGGSFAKVEIDGDRLSIGGTVELAVLDAKGKARLALSPEGARVALSPDGRYVASSPYDPAQGGGWHFGTASRLAVWEVATGKKVWETKGPEDGAMLAFSADGRTLFAAGVRGAPERHPLWPAVPEPMTLVEAWEALAWEKGHAAIASLADRGDRAAAWIAARLPDKDRLRNGRALTVLGQIAAQRKAR